MIQSSALNDELLIHFGVKGMKWGRRRKRPDEAERKKIFRNAERNRKIKIGAAVVGGAIATSLILSKRGRDSVADLAITNYAQGRAARTQAVNNPVRNLVQRFRDVKASSVPSPRRMVSAAGVAGGSSVNATTLAETQRRLRDPNYVWQL